MQYRYSFKANIHRHQARFIELIRVNRSLQIIIGMALGHAFDYKDFLKASESRSTGALDQRCSWCFSNRGTCCNGSIDRDHRPVEFDLGDDKQFGRFRPCSDLAY